MILKNKSKNQKVKTKILISKKELIYINYELLEKVISNIDNNLIGSDSNMQLTVNFLIGANNIIFVFR